MSDVPAPVGAVDMEKVKDGLRRMLPVLKALAAVTSNPYDDLAVAYLEQILNLPAA
jgi:hypothetical protein